MDSARSCESDQIRSRALCLMIKGLSCTQGGAGRVVVKLHGIVFFIFYIRVSELCTRKIVSFIRSQSLRSLLANTFVTFSLKLNNLARYCWRFWLPLSKFTFFEWIKPDNWSCLHDLQNVTLINLISPSYGICYKSIRHTFSFHQSTRTDWAQIVFGRQWVRH